MGSLEASPEVISGKVPHVKQLTKNIKTHAMDDLQIISRLHVKRSQMKETVKGQLKMDPYYLHAYSFLCAEHTREGQDAKPVSG